MLNLPKELDPVFGIMARQDVKEAAAFYRGIKDEDARRNFYELVESFASFYGALLPKLRKPKPRKVLKLKRLGGWDDLLCRSRLPIKATRRSGTRKPNKKR